ncbi:class II fructose-1,6-bisphosphate aldolase [Anaerococcus obesiensis]|uniref:Class II fructose-1,6-bisphosphate aldolase n=1 Tax=Anaerococcus obesiensis TaxID=1287640 RepID=A0A7T7ZUZ9_9FIRM|nr:MULTISPECIES: class II fructose-1,6-bisphosphate aldolase [Anaerococcus]MDU2375661.1 class II fructose-1,6-bisphosphate aldolase [Anaerococcus vaginalis]MDU5461458.1 class II fructose-1,6-bisphosphate aldolase [Anaerococcus vaginalis]OFJ73064.1 fructose-bisphosphate aldolase [Anaerococcus sp. HMSC065G05]QQN56036.1 class II fructose-1,6-bisphosphate aldolase [Anaerococcus obesiensis]
MLVNAKEMLDKAYENGYGIGQFNINNLEWTKAILEACEEKKSAVILGVSEGAAKYMGGFNVVSKMVEGLDKDLNITVPVALHLDHGSYEGAKKALEAGFTSIMFDGSSLPIDENIEKTKEIVELCHSKNVSVEAEVGGIGGEEDGVVSAGELADPEECKKVASLGIDFLAAGIGNIHGVYPEDWQGLNFKRLEEIKEAAGKIPLVLHGGTGIPEEQVKKAIERGVSKININTECQIVFTEATRKYFEEGKDKVGKGFDPRKVLKPGFEAIKDKVREKIEFFECENSAEK